MTTAARSKVLSAFKALHRTRKVVFRGDDYALNAARLKINEEFRMHASVTDSNEVTKLIQVANEADEMLRTKVLQAREVRPNVYQLRSEDLRDKCTNARVGCGRADCHCVP